MAQGDQQQVPADDLTAAYHLAAAFQLGHLQKVHKPTIGHGGLISLILCILFFISLGLYLLFNAPRDLLFSVITGLILLCLIILCAYGILVHIFETLPLLRLRAYEYTDGFALIEGDSNVIAAMRWDQVQIMWIKVRELPQTAYHAVGRLQNKVGFRRSFSLIGTNGGEITLDLFLELWRRLEGEFIRQRLPQALAVYHTYQFVPFGLLGVSQQGIELNAQDITILWREISRIRIYRTNLVFERERAPSLSVPLSQVPNVCLLEALLITISGGHISRIEGM